MPASGAADAETLDGARQSAPLTVLTMDRIVSRQDFEDFARGFAGIGKAQAAFLWNGEHPIVHLTIAGTGGAALDPASDLYRNLSAAIDAAGHTEQDVRIDTYQPLLFNVSARVLVDSRYLSPEVLAAAAAAVSEAFSFEHREFGQPVLKSELLAVIQDVEGVVAVDLDALYLSTQASALHAAIEAKRAMRAGAAIAPAELLTVHPAGISFVEMI
jgi:predicted phage baseplate assembly protein